MLSLRSAQDFTNFNVPAKTPARNRPINLPSTLLKENASRHPNTSKSTRIVYPATPAAKLASSSFDDDRTTLLKPSAVTNTRLIALVDKTNKTPYPARLPFPVTPVPSGKLQLGVTPRISIDAPASVLRPSSTRKSLRAPRKSFETPEKIGRRPHWDISDGEIDADVNVSGVSGQEIIEEEDDDDVEYMPPSYLDESFDPGFDVPDYRAVGADVMYFDKHPTTGVEWQVDWNTMHEQAELVQDSPLHPKRSYAPENPFHRPQFPRPDHKQRSKPDPILKKPLNHKVVSRPPTSTASRPASNSRQSSRPLQTRAPSTGRVAPAINTTRGSFKHKAKSAHSPKPAGTDLFQVGRDDAPAVPVAFDDFHFDF
ncbi:hypothetical protein FRB90_004746 [Tulasnella sp. 427]|nr:hypothetical protein FRB90_004746 [Tulasnella sp. 427]